MGALDPRVQEALTGYRYPVIILSPCPSVGPDSRDDSHLTESMLVGPRTNRRLNSYLLSREASYMHGSVVYVDGGCDAAIRPDGY
jgi:hypothetical protein